MAEKREYATYTYRPDGNYLCLEKCFDCEEFFFVHAMSNTMSIALCPACQQLRKWYEEGEFSK